MNRRMKDDAWFRFGLGYVHQPEGIWLLNSVGNLVTDVSVALDKELCWVVKT